MYQPMGPGGQAMGQQGYPGQYISQTDGPAPAPPPGIPQQTSYQQPGNMQYNTGTW